MVLVKFLFINNIMYHEYLDVMKKLIICICAFMYAILINGQIIIDTSNFKPFDISPALGAINSYNNAYSRAVEQFSINYDKAQEYYSNGNYTAAKMYLDRCNRINAQFRGNICDQKTLDKSIEQVNAAIEYQEQMKKAIEAYNIGVDAYLKEKYTLAIPKFNEAAKFGIPEAQCMLGYCYEYGIGVATNVQIASEWYQKAASQGYEKAKSALLDLQMKAKANQVRK